MERITYPTDVSDREWEILKILMPSTPEVGRPREAPWREIVNGIFYITRAGCAWRLLPHDFPKWFTVYYYFRLWRKMGIWEKINDELRKTVRMAAGKKEDPTAAIIDSQSIKTTEAGGEKGFDAGKKINGRKRHIIVDTNGMLLKVNVHPADIQDRDGAKNLLKEAREKLPTLSMIWADGGYAGKLVEWSKSKVDMNIEIIKRTDKIKGFKVLSRRWVVERTFGWLGKNRRLSKDYERVNQTSESFIYLGMTRLMIRRLALNPSVAVF